MCDKGDTINQAPGAAETPSARFASGSAAWKRGDAPGGDGSAAGAAAGRAGRARSGPADPRGEPGTRLRSGPAPPGPSRPGPAPLALGGGTKRASPSRQNERGAAGGSGQELPLPGPAGPRAGAAAPRSGPCQGREGWTAGDAVLKEIILITKPETVPQH